MGNPTRGVRPRTRILFLDDEVPVVAVISRLLQQKQYDVVTAHSADAGRALLENGTGIRCAVVDVDLGEGKENGLEFVAWLKTMRPNVGVIVVSAHEQHAVPTGVTFIPKPFTTDQLVGAIERECA